eukprot:TRINITY_DN17055_c2_g1_i2.p1 TRINITY_DN17055_c2_g1~~TRINITY_DN17055_c2_g1_i2.p1  ORF type:complete len:391 (-),score=53.77 TRINITY_DN17055_c2_g1_i2:199-1239(-)
MSSAPDGRTLASELEVAEICELPPERSVFEKPRIMRMPDFSLENVDEWLKHLASHGVVRIRGVLDVAGVAEAKDLFWDWLEGLGGKARRDDVSTWTNANFPGNLNIGFLSSRGAGQSAAAWAVRGNRNVHRAFSEIWGTDSLISSMDSFIGWRPWWVTVEGQALAQKPRSEGIHCDQNPHARPGLACVQGMVPLLPVRREIGGLCVVPGSHADEVQQFLRTEFCSKQGDWLPLEMKCPQHSLNRQSELIEAEPGDLILWDSRALHGGYVGDGLKKIEPPDAQSQELARLSLPVCMTPKEWASEEILEKRRYAVQRGITLTHWPHGYEQHGFRDSDGLLLVMTHDVC